jgi:hypothetical protein
MQIAHRRLDPKHVLIDSDDQVRLFGYGAPAKQE